MDIRVATNEGILDRLRKKQKNGSSPKKSATERLAWATGSVPR
jgi:hypothetical protein